MLEIRFVLYNEMNGTFLDGVSGKTGADYNGRAFRTSVALLSKFKYKMSRARGEGEYKSFFE